MSSYVYHATDTDAPLLTSTVGSLINVLDLCLCSGYHGRPTPGWTIPFFSGSDIAVFKNGTGSHNRFFKIFDNLVGSENMSIIHGYENMSDIDTFYNNFPNGTQAPNNAWIFKSVTADTMIKNWIVLANPKICYLIISPDATTTFENASVTVFGDFISYNSSVDIYNTLLIYNGTNSSSTNYSGFFLKTCPIGQVFTDHVAVRSYTGLGGSKTLGKHYDTNKTDVIFPNPIDGSLVMSPFYITEEGVLRGYLPGIWKMCPNRSNFQHGDLFEGTGALSGKLFEICKMKDGILALEISDTW
jgi:hypothetical protein